MQRSLIVVACADGNNRLARIKWQSYGTDAASGTATAVVNDCEPNCAAGEFHRFRAVVTLTKPKTAAATGSSRAWSSDSPTTSRTRPARR